MIAISALIVLALATYRATQLAVWDSITQPLRNAVERWHANKPDSAWRSALTTLASCVYCAGWWIAGALLATYLLTTGTWHDAPLLVHGIEWLAVAGAGVLLNRWDDTREAAR